MTPLISMYPILCQYPTPVNHILDSNLLGQKMNPQHPSTKYYGYEFILRQLWFHRQVQVGVGYFLGGMNVRGRGRQAEKVGFQKPYPVKILSMKYPTPQVELDMLVPGSRILKTRQMGSG